MPFQRRKQAYADNLQDNFMSVKTMAMDHAVALISGA
jgi:hypothetical protein